MRIAFGVHGYGRGHATRALAVLSELSRRHDVCVLAGADAYDAMAGEHSVVRVPSLGYAYRRGGSRSNWLTFKQVAPQAIDALTHGPVSRLVEDHLRDFRPDVIICDAELWTARVGKRMGIPRISFDHFGILAYCRPPMRIVDRMLSYRDVALYRWMMAEPERVIVSSFYDAPAQRSGVAIVPTLLRDDVRRHKPSRGEHILAYFNKGQHLFSPRIEAALQELGVPAIVYGTHRSGEAGKLCFKPVGASAFLSDLASCRAVFSTAGNQLVGEALHFGKPLLVMPEDCVEQRVNAAGVERLGIGHAVRQGDVSPRVLKDFLAQEARFRAAAARHARDGQAEAVAALERFMEELAPTAARSTRVQPRVA